MCIFREPECARKTSRAGAEDVESLLTELENLHVQEA